MSRVVFVGRPPGPPDSAPFRPPAYAPPEPVAAPPPEPVAAPPEPVAAAPAPPAPPVPPAPRASHPVRLGFADGSELALPADDPAAAALRALADRISGAGS